MAQARLVGPDHAHGVLGDLEAVSLGRERAVERLDRLAIGDPPTVGRRPAYDRGRGSRIGAGATVRSGASVGVGSGLAAQAAGSQGPSGRSPWATMRASSLRTTGRSSAWVTPMQRPGPSRTRTEAGSPSRRPAGDHVAHHLGEQHLGVVGESGRIGHRAVG